MTTGDPAAKKTSSLSSARSSQLSAALLPAELVSDVTLVSDAKLTPLAPPRGGAAEPSCGDCVLLAALVCDVKLAQLASPRGGAAESSCGDCVLLAALVSDVKLAPLAWPRGGAAEPSCGDCVLLAEFLAESAVAGAALRASVTGEETSRLATTFSSLWLIVVW